MSSIFINLMYPGTVPMNLSQWGINANVQVQYLTSHCIIGERKQMTFRLRLIARGAAWT